MHLCVECKSPTCLACLNKRKCHICGGREQCPLRVCIFDLILVLLKSFFSNLNNFDLFLLSGPRNKNDTKNACATISTKYFAD